MLTTLVTFTVPASYCEPGLTLGFTKLLYHILSVILWQLICLRHCEGVVLWDLCWCVCVCVCVCACVCVHLCEVYISFVKHTPCKPRTWCSRMGGNNAWFQAFVHVQNFPRNLGNRVILVFFWVMATCSDSDDEFSSALVLRLIYTGEGYSDWKPWRNDHVVIAFLFTPWCCVMMY